MSLYKKAFFTGIARIFTQPRLSIPLILTLGLTLGAVLTVATISNTLLLQPLSGINNEKDILNYDLKLKMSDKFTIPFFTKKHLHDINDYFKDAGIWAGISTKPSSLKVNNVSFAATEVVATPNILEVLGSKLIKGESVNISDPEKYIWLSSSLWNSAFNGQNSAVGGIIQIKNEDYIVAGIIEDVLAIQSEKEILSQQYWHIKDPKKAAAIPETGNVGGNIDSLLLFTKNKSAAPTVEDMQQWQTQYIENNLPADNVAFFLQWMKQMQTETVIKNYRDSLLGETTSLLTALSIAVIGLLLMAVLNLFNIYIAHYQTRAKEFALQLTTGASQLKLKTMIWLENFPLFVLAIVTGLLTTGWLIRLLPTLASDIFPLIQSIHIDEFTLVLSIGVIILINTVFSYLALIHINKKQLANNLNHSGKGTQTQVSNTISRGLMVVQMAIASILLTATVMLAMQSYQAVYRDLGYDYSNSYEISLGLGSTEAYADNMNNNKANPEKLAMLQKEISEIIETNITGSRVIVPSNGPLSGSVAIHTVTDGENSDPIMFAFRLLSADYFEAFKIPFLAGSNLSQQQIDNKENRIVIDEALAKLLFPNLSLEEIIGKDYPFRGGEGTPADIIQGIVPFTYSQAGTISGGHFPTLYRAEGDYGLPMFTIKVPKNTVVDNERITNAIQEKYPEYDQVNITSLERLWLEQTKTQRISLWIIITVAFLTIFLAALGISGLTQITTNQRKYELAIRMATGAKQSKLLRFILKDAFWMLFIGLGLGFIVSVFCYQPLKQQLTMFPEFNWLVMSFLDTGLIIVVLSSVLIPAWRVISSDPMQSLREE